LNTSRTGQQGTNVHSQSLSNYADILVTIIKLTTKTMMTRKVYTLFSQQYYNVRNKCTTRYNSTIQL